MKKVKFRGVDMEISLVNGKVNIYGIIKGKGFTAVSDKLSIYEDCDSEDARRNHIARHLAHANLRYAREAYEDSL